MIVDYHVHLRGPMGPDGAEPLVHTLDAIERFVERATERGVDEVGFTEHVYYFRQTREIWSLDYNVERCVFDLDAYCGIVLEAKHRGLPVKLGLEVDAVRDRQERLAELLEPYPWDFLLGSVHEVLDAPVDTEPGIWERLTVEEVWRRYFEQLLELARSGTVDVIAHPDLVKIYGRRPEAPVVEELHAAAARGLAEAGVAVEISTAGLRKPVAEVYPAEGFLSALRAQGVPITTASDAHEPRFVGEDIDQAVTLAQRVGYETVCVFDGRRRCEEPLG